MKKVLKGVFFVGAFALSSNAYSDILIEPYAGFGVGNYEVGRADDSHYSFTYGARAGVQYLGFMGGLDYSLTTDHSTIGGDGKDSRTGVFVGYEFPILVRAWATYYLSAEKEFDTHSDNGSGWGLGIGFTGLPFVSINAEYKKFSYDDREFADNTKKGISSNESQFLVSVSLPLTF